MTFGKSSYFAHRISDFSDVCPELGGGQKYGTILVCERDLLILSTFRCSTLEVYDIPQRES